MMDPPRNRLGCEMWSNENSISGNWHLSDRPGVLRHGHNTGDASIVSGRVSPAARPTERQHEPGAYGRAVVFVSGFRRSFRVCTSILRVQISMLGSGYIFSCSCCLWGFINVLWIDLRVLRIQMSIIFGYFVCLGHRMFL